MVTLRDDDGINNFDKILLITTDETHAETYYRTYKPRNKGIFENFMEGGDAISIFSYEVNAVGVVINKTRLKRCIKAVPLDEWVFGSKPPAPKQKRT